ncbi:SIR2 family protein [Emticicia sp. SJ17W-69]|uniref:SIR2 family protein n=1 Tax=Emticicia sp. SJ17W-69 TaxID=3421657 RepID=UPI003EBAC701
MKKFDTQIQTFIKDFSNNLQDDNVAIFAGAGMSKACGYVDWKQLLKDIAEELELEIDKENDLISLAQFHVNHKGSKQKLNEKILNEFSEEAETSENHRILARLPISTYWTTNYDTLIEKALKEERKKVAVKRSVRDLNQNVYGSHATVFKMHGDTQDAANAILTKDQYEVYHFTHLPFVTALKGNLVQKTFLFIGFSFEDPNLDYILSRVRIEQQENGRIHYCTMRRVNRTNFGNKPEDEAEYQYKKRKQELQIQELKRYHIEALLIDDYDDITEILRQVEASFKANTIFISGSAEEYGLMDKDTAQGFIHKLSKQIVENKFRIVNGFGWGVGSAVINGALEAIYDKSDKYNESQLILRPFPQFKTGNKELPELWHEYREKMIDQSGIAIFIFGNKKDKSGNIIMADGVRKEFEIAKEQGCYLIPIGITGYMALELLNELIVDFDTYYPNHKHLRDEFQKLGDTSLSEEDIFKNLKKILNSLKK